MPRNSLPKANILGVQYRGSGGRSPGGVGQNRKGTFAPKYDELEAQFRRIGEQLQQRVLEAFEGSLQRPQRPTKYLYEALASPDALVASLDGFVFLPQNYLENSQARTYWRGLEEGTFVHVGQPIKFFLRNGSIAPARAAEFREDTYLVAPSSRTGSKHETPHAEDLAANPKADRRGIYRRPGGYVTIKRPIEAHRFLEKGTAEWAAGFPQAARELVTQVFSGAFQ